MRILCLFLLLLVSGANTSAQSKKFEFIAFGDMPYRLLDDYVRFENLIKTVNKEKPAFSVHVGDFKSGSTVCSDEYFNKIFNYFESFSRPLIYTPGDNEWTDCNREAAGKYDPLERLILLRKMFFKDSKSLGQKKMPLNSQSSNPDKRSTILNFTRLQVFGDADIATVHVTVNPRSKELFTVRQMLLN